MRTQYSYTHSLACVHDSMEYMYDQRYYYSHHSHSTWTHGRRHTLTHAQHTDKTPQSIKYSTASAMQVINRKLCALGVSSPTIVHNCTNSSSLYCGGDDNGNDTLLCNPSLFHSLAFPIAAFAIDFQLSSHTYVSRGAASNNTVE